MAGATGLVVLAAWGIGMSTAFFSDACGKPNARLCGIPCRRRAGRGWGGRLFRVGEPRFFW